jgi:hypothetical protein
LIRTKLDNELHIISIGTFVSFFVGEAEGGYSAAKANFGLPSTVSVFPQNYNVSTGMMDFWFQEA